MTKRLTRRRLEIFAASLAMGNRDAGESLGVSEQTVKNHVGDLFRILGVRSRTEAAIVLGWLEIPEEYRPGPKPKPVHRRHADAIEEALSDD